MLIHGEVSVNDTDEILKNLAQLPSSFPHYRSNPSIGPLTPEWQKSYNEAVALYNKATNALSRGDTRQGLRELEQVEQISAIQTDKGLLSGVNLLMARGYQRMGQADKATEKLQNAAQYSLETTQYYNEASKYYNAENLYKELASLHKQQNTISVYQEKLQNDLTTSRRSNDQPLELETRLALGAVYRVQNNQEAAVQHYSAAYSLQQGKVDYEAHRVEQREVGFSNREKIGTDNIQQCVAVIIYDPESKETALAHVDRFTDPKSLSDEVIDKFPLPAVGKKLQVYLIGGRDRSPGSIAVSDGNIRKVMEVLKTYPHIDIKSADIGNKEIPSGVVFDPLTGKLEHAIPGKESETAALRQARLNLMTPGDNSSKLNFAFDLGESKTIPTQKLTELEQRSLVQTWYEYDASITPIGVPETRQSKTTSNLSKVTEEIRKDNPQLVAEIFKERIETNIDKLNVTNDKKQKLRSRLVAATVASLADHTKPLSEIHADVTNTIQQNTPKKTWRDILKEGFKAVKEAVVKTFNDLKDTMVKIFSSGSANDPKNKYAAPPEPTTNKTEDKGKVTIKNTEQAKYKSFSQIPPPPQTPPVPHQQQKNIQGDNIMVRIEIKSAEYKIVNAVNDLILYTTELGDEVACSFFSLKLKKVALARNIDGNQLKQLINELNPNNLLDLGLIRVQLIGGEAGSTTSLEYLRQIIETLKIVDNNHNIINIISCDTSERLHPNSFEIDCYHGGIRNLALSF